MGTSVREGDTVYYYNPSLHPRSTPTLPVKATIASVGRTLVTLEINGRVLRGKFRIDTGRENVPSPTSYTRYFLTEAGKAEGERRTANEAVFRAVKLNLFGSKLTGDDAQAIADLLRSRGYSGEEDTSCSQQS